MENKRLGHMLQVAQIVQEQRGNRRSSNGPARTNQGRPAFQLKRTSGKKSQRALDANDLALAITQSNEKRTAATS